MGGQKLKMSRKYVSYATFKERQFSYVGKLKRQQHLCQCWHIALALLFMTAISTVLYLRLSLDDRHSSPYPPNRKMAGILSYELGYLVWDPSPTNESSRIP